MSLGPLQADKWHVPAIISWVSTVLSSVDVIEQRLRIIAILVAVASGLLAIVLQIKKIMRNRQRGDW